MVLKSNYEIGVFSNGQWICACNKKANWNTSKQPHSKGEKCEPFQSRDQLRRLTKRYPVLRCPNQGNDQCDFFLTANDEPGARMEKTEPPIVPRTPLQGQASIKRYLPTPNTDRIMISTKTPRRNLFGKSPSVASASRIDSEREEGDLTSSILGILEKDGVSLKASTRLRIQSLVEEFRAGLEAKLAASNASFERVMKHIDEMENEARAAGPST